MFCRHHIVKGYRTTEPRQEINLLFCIRRCFSFLCVSFFFPSSSFFFYTVSPSFVSLEIRPLGGKKKSIFRWAFNALEVKVTLQTYARESCGLSEFRISLSTTQRVLGRLDAGQKSQDGRPG